MITTYNTMSGSKCPLRSTKSIEYIVSSNHKRSRKLGVQTLLNGLKSQQLKYPSLSNGCMNRVSECVRMPLQHSSSEVFILNTNELTRSF